MRPSTIAIDGTAASGKSTIGESLARRLGYIYLDTGAMYRAVTWVALQRGLDIGDEAAIAALADEVEISITHPTVDDGRQYTVYADGDDITWQIRCPEVDANVSPVSAYPGVRRALTAQQRRIGRRGRVVMVGRDIGTVVMPDADLKIYLDATVEERACRRYRELLERGEPADYGEVLVAMRRRDKIDSEREAAPLRPAEDAVILDTTNLTVEEVLAKVMELVEEWGTEGTNLRITNRESANHAPWRKIFRHLARCLVRVLFRLFSRLEVKGLENAPAGGPLIVVFNHLAHLDDPLLIATLPWTMEAIALADLYRVPVTGQFLRLYGTIPVRRDEFDREVIKRALKVLAEGKVLAIAPEAGMSLTGALRRAWLGAAYFALRSGAPILPVAISGTDRIYSEWRRLRRPRLTVNIGQPFTPPPYESKGEARRWQLADVTDQLMRRIAELLPPEYRGVYG